MILFRVTIKTRESFGFSAFAHPCEPIKLCVDHLPAPVGSSPPIRRKIRRFAASIRVCLPVPRASRGYPPATGLRDTAQAAVGRRAGSFNSEKNGDGNVIGASLHVTRISESLGAVSAITAASLLVSPTAGGAGGYTGYGGSLTRRPGVRQGP